MAPSPAPSASRIPVPPIALFPPALRNNVYSTSCRRGRDAYRVHYGETVRAGAGGGAGEGGGQRKGEEGIYNRSVQPFCTTVLHNPHRGASRTASATCPRCRRRRGSSRRPSSCRRGSSGSSAPLPGLMGWPRGGWRSSARRAPATARRRRTAGVRGGSRWRSAPRRRRSEAKGSNRHARHHTPRYHTASRRCVVCLARERPLRASLVVASHGTKDKDYWTETKNKS
jgi:hypothetical protein